MVFTHELPSQGCNIFYGTYIDNYFNNVRSRYYLNDGQLVLASTSSYSNLPSGVHCLETGEEIIYKPEVDIYFQFIAILSITLMLFFAYRLLIHPFWRRS